MRERALGLGAGGAPWQPAKARSNPLSPSVRRNWVSSDSICRSSWSVICCISGEKAPVSNPDRKSTRLNSSHLGISYAVFCLKKKKAMVSESLGRALWPDRDPVGQCMRVGSDTMPCTEVSGIAEDAVHVFFFNDTATTEIYTLSLHDALPI